MGVVDRQERVAERWPVQKLWMNREFPVDEATPKLFLRSMAPKTASRATVRRPSSVASLDRFLRKRRIRRGSQKNLFRSTHVANAVHRFEELIGGRPYLIEVAAVSSDRWRAYIVKRPGVPTALMPFYGRTPAEAARQLSDWLTRAHARAASP